MGEHYNLRWNNYSNNLIQVFSEHQHQEILVDVVLICEGQYVRAHKLILSACSSFFQEMFKAYGNISNPFIVMNGIKLAHLRHIIEFIYHGEIKVLDSDLEGVLALGEYFQVKGLCSVKVKHSLQPEETKSVPQSTAVATSPKLRSINSNLGHPNQTPSVSPRSVNNNTPNRTEIESKQITKVVEDEHFSHNSENTNSFEKNMKTRLAQLSDSEQPVKKKPKSQIVFKEEFSHEMKSCLDNKSVSREDKEVKKNIGILENANFKDIPKSGLTYVSEKKEVGSTVPAIEETIDVKPEKIPRPANAFMIFANEWRKKLSVEHPGDNSKSISVKLGNLWKSLSSETRESYYSAARQAQLEHQLKYPGYYVHMPASTKINMMERRKTVDGIDSSDLKESDEDLQIIENQEDVSNGTNIPHP
ncbi:uncharacterized protein isoform X1 [Leptinotarsa decemlineata]|uniref:uncharacterized protein isoform X1 n=1 Tax=Leptinotarsa decemlineata TaxID=7539 RepID=UPI003D304D83